MKVCPECGRSYSTDAVVCAYDGVPLSAGSTASWESSKQSDEPAPGDVLGQYRIIDKIARGGMGVIYRAQHIRLGRQVALKVLKPSLVDRSDVVQRFFTEARAVNEIGHPNIVDVIDFVELADQQPALVYMVMELLVGEDLGRRIRTKGPLHPDEATAIADLVADALAATHRRKILHRDLKPENVFLVDQGDDTPPRIKLLDFGIAAAFGQKKQQRLTSPGSAVGTPAYMSPEQVLERDLDERTDIYALGLLLYEMLTGTVPFAAASSGETLIMQVQEAPEPLGKRRTVPPPVPPALEQIVMTCLQKDPKRRFQNMGQVRAALGSATTETALPVSELPGRRRRSHYLAAAVGVLALGAAGVGAWVLVSPSSSRKGADGKVHTAGSSRLASGAPDAATKRDLAVATAAAPPGRRPVASAEHKSRRPGRRPAKSTRSKISKSKTSKTTKDTKASRGRDAIKKNGRESTVDPFKL